jgi:hypothetical protein
VDEERIDVPVITAFELDDFVAPRKAAGKADARHCRLGPAVHHPHLFDRRHPAADEFRHLHLERIGNAKAHATSGRFAHGVDYYRRGMPEDRGSPCSDVVDVFRAIHVPNARAVCPLDKKRIAAQPAERAHGGIHSAGDMGAGAGKEIGREGRHRGQRSTFNAERSTLNDASHDGEGRSASPAADLENVSAQCGDVDLAAGVFA